MANDIAERMQRAEDQLNDLYDAQAISDEPWDFTDAIHDQREYLAGLREAQQRSQS